MLLYFDFCEGFKCWCGGDCVGKGDVVPLSSACLLGASVVCNSMVPGKVLPLDDAPVTKALAKDRISGEMKSLLDSYGFLVFHLLRILDVSLYVDCVFADPPHSLPKSRMTRRTNCEAVLDLPVHFLASTSTVFLALQWHHVASCCHRQWLVIQLMAWLRLDLNAVADRHYSSKVRRFHCQQGLESRVVTLTTSRFPWIGCLWWHCRREPAV